MITTQQEYQEYLENSDLASPGDTIKIDLKKGISVILVCQLPSILEYEGEIAIYSLVNRGKNFFNPHLAYHLNNQNKHVINFKIGSLLECSPDIDIDKLIGKPIILSFRIISCKAHRNDCFLEYMLFINGCFVHTKRKNIHKKLYKMKDAFEQFSGASIHLSELMVYSKYLNGEELHKSFDWLKSKWEQRTNDK